MMSAIIVKIASDPLIQKIVFTIPKDDNDFDKEVIEFTESSTVATIVTTRAYFKSPILCSQLEAEGMRPIDDHCRTWVKK